MEYQTMTQLERDHVHCVYSQIAPHFSDTRFKPWPRIAQFLEEQPPGSLIADIGCGNGKYLGVNPRATIIGSDICPELVSIARIRGHEVAVLDCLHLPYRDGVFDAAICIAVVHHLSTEERRLIALKELARIVRSGGGRMLVYVWAMEQERKKFTNQDVLVPWHLQPKYTDQSTSPVKPKASRADSAKAAAKRAKKADKRKKKSEKKREKADGRLSEDGGAMGMTMENVEDEDCGGDGSLLLGGLQGLCVEDLGNDGKELEQQHHNCTPTQRREELKETSPLQDHRSEESCGGSPRSSEAAASERASECADLTVLGYKTFQRYYHMFCRNELTKLFSLVGGVTVLEEFYDHENWCVLAEKS